MEYTVTHKRPKIKELKSDQRPREKLLALGEEHLSDTELLTILISTGSLENDALQIAREVNKNFPLQQLHQVKSEDLIKIKGLGKTKVTRIKAACELGRRIFNSPDLVKNSILNVEDVIKECKSISNKSQEYLQTLYLNTRHELIHKETIGIGRLNINIIEPKEVFAPAMSIPCTYIILVHNHPSGDPTPSEADLTFTKQIHEAAHLLGFDLLDHVILARNKFYSLSRSSQNRKDS